MISDPRGPGFTFYQYFTRCALEGRAKIVLLFTEVAFGHEIHADRRVFNDRSIPFRVSKCERFPVLYVKTSGSKATR